MGFTQRRARSPSALMRISRSGTPTRRCGCVRIDDARPYRLHALRRAHGERLARNCAQPWSHRGARRCVARRAGIGAVPTARRWRGGEAARATVRRICPIDRQAGTGAARFGGLTQSAKAAVTTSNNEQAGYGAVIGPGHQRRLHHLGDTVFTDQGDIDLGERRLCSSSSTSLARAWSGKRSPSSA